MKSLKRRIVEGTEIKTKKNREGKDLYLRCYKIFDLRSLTSNLYQNIYCEIDSDLFFDFRYDDWG